jgi:hypothetical protein
LLRKPELDAVQAKGTADWGPDTRGKVLVVVEGFLGWDRSDNWDDVSFSAVYGRRIDQIAIVAEPKWEAQLLMFTAAGIRRTPVRFFLPDQYAQARAWLAESPIANNGAGS